MASTVAPSLFDRRPDPFWRFFFYSLGGHAGLVLIFGTLNYFTSHPSIDLNQKPIVASLVRRGTPRDEKLLPRKDEVPPPPKKSDGNDVAEVKMPNKAPSILAAIDAAKSKKQPGENDGSDRRKELFGAFNKVSKTADTADGQLDGDPDGDSATAEGERYWAILRAQVKRNYDVSQTLSEQERMHLRAQVLLRIGRAGDIIEATLASSSGNSLFDHAVVNAAKHASPFAPPPENLRASLQTVGVKLEFRP